MTLHNATEFEAGYNLGLEKSGKHCLVVVAKVSYKMPNSIDEHAIPLPKAAQMKVCYADVYLSDDEESAIRYENDFAPYKPKCDVLLNGSAYAAPLKQTPSTTVQLKVSTMDKSFRVIGERVWESGLLGAQASSPKPFSRQEISYHVAYGGYGFDPAKPSEGEENYVGYDANPSGIGYYPFLSDRQLVGRALAQTEELHRQASRSQGKDYVPQSFGVIARHWQARRKLGGTYDAHWAENVKPFLPDDFDEHFYQSAPHDQQIPYLVGGERVYLRGLVPEGEREFILPRQEIAMEVIRSNGDREKLTPVVDTLILEPDASRIVMLSRAKVTLKRSIHEIDTIIVGTPDSLWEKKRLFGECYEEPQEEEVTHGE